MEPIYFSSALDDPPPPPTFSVIGSRSQAEQVAYQKASQEREYESLHTAHALYRADRQTVKQANHTLHQFERIEYLWETLRAHCWKVGKERLIERKRMEKEREEERKRVEALAVERELLQLATEGRRRSVRGGGGGGTGEGLGRRSSVRSGGGGETAMGVDERRKSVRGGVGGGVTGEVMEGRRNSVRGRGDVVAEGRRSSVRARA
jgi:hypothetical protein